MSNNRIVFRGLEELKAELRALPAELASEAGNVVEGTAIEASATVHAEYERHRVTGELADSLKVLHVSAGQFGAAYVVKATSKIAWLFDNGSQARHWLSGKSTGAMWGKTPPTHVFVKTMTRARTKMYQTLKGVVERKGLVVTGEP